MPDDPLILGIETSCDETAAAVAAGRRALSSVVASQVEIHARYGGVVPEVASRQHLLAILPTVGRALTEASVRPGDLQAIAVTCGPGLAGSLLVGVNAAKGLALGWNLPLIGVNHLEAHIYANFLEVGDEKWEMSGEKLDVGGGKRHAGSGILEAAASHLPPPISHLSLPSFPLLCLIVSGGHTDLVLMEKHLSYRMLGRTRDDAAGEAFDKAARMLGVGYPGGPAIQRAAAQGHPGAVGLPRAWLKGSNDFSFSGLKTALWHLVRDSRLAAAAGSGRPDVYDAAASFQEAVAEVLVTKTLQVARRQGVRSLLLAGGVAANSRLRELFRERSPIPVFIPPLSLCTDNAAMVAVCGSYCFQAGRVSGLDLDLAPDLALGE